MKTITLEVPRSGLNLKITGKTGCAAQVVLVLPEEVEVVETRVDAAASATPVTQQQQPVVRSTAVSPVTTPNGFPARALTEETIVEILREHGGSVRITDTNSGWNIYDEIAARLGVSIAARRRPTAGTGEPAWRPEVGFARKNLEQRGVIKPTDQSGRGVWTLDKGHMHPEGRPS